MLLSAVERRFPLVKCVGIEIDRSVALALKRRKTHWTVSAADLMKPASVSQTAALSAGVGCDLLVMNPPYSMGSGKGGVASFRGNVVRCGVAMAYLLRAIELFAPADAVVAVLPESLMYSALDRDARGLLVSEYDLAPVMSVRNTAFAGARVNSWLVHMARRHTSLHLAEAEISTSVCALTVRGGLPVHEARRVRRGIPFVHSTDLRALRGGRRLAQFTRVLPIKRGCVQGCVVLLPRVGYVHSDQVVATNLQERIQLSDCVIAIRTKDMRAAQSVRRAILANWTNFLSAYRGTAARYVTVARLEAWLGACPGLEAIGEGSLLGAGQGRVALSG